MVYREHSRDIQQGRSDDPDQTLLSYDASGRHGELGTDGHNGSDGMGSGSDGSDGGDAGAAERGQDGGTIRLQLDSRGVQGTAYLSGEQLRADGRGVSINEQLDYGDCGYLDLRARGGHGGDGGDGGRGGDGARGRSGSNATRYSSGGDGGRGGDGGHGGRASSGADGGRGGEVVVEVAEQDTHLLMLLRHAVDGGGGGAAGTNGSGGSAGAGGSGGSSYSWTESESYTDSQGNSRTRTTYHSNPGGSSGPSGNSGSPGRASVSPGSNGADGSFSIAVEGAGSTTDYPGCFDLKLTAFEHASENEDGVYEPQERVRVFNVEVENVGGMPTPSHHDIEVNLRQQGWVLPADERLLLPRGLAAGATHRFESDALHFEIGDYQPRRPDEPLRCNEVVGQMAALPDVQREFRGYWGTAGERCGAFVIRFPTVATDPRSLCALAPGEAAFMRWEITNSSKVAFGAGAENGRRLRFRLYANESELGDEQAALLDGDGRKLTLADGYSHEIDRLDAGQTSSFEATIGFRDAAPHYRSLNLWLALELGFIKQPAQLRTVQLAAFKARVARRYRHRPDAELLLVVNHRTTRDELDAWHALAAELGLELNVWDLSLHGGIDLESERDGGSLIEQLAGRTIVVLNNEVQMPGGARAAHRLVDKAQLNAAAEAGISVAFIGKGVGIQRVIVPTEDVADSEPAHPSAGALVTAMVKCERAELLELSERVEVNCWRLFGGAPKPRLVIKRAQRLQRELARRYPDLRFVVVHEFAPELIKKVAWMGSWRAGRLEVRAMLPAAAGSFVSAKMDEERVHDPVYVRSDDNVMTLLLTHSFEEKLQRLDQLLSEAQEPASEGRSHADFIGLVVDALLVDLANEQAAILEMRWRGGLSRSAMLRSLPLLRKLASFLPTTSGRTAPDSPEGAHLVRLVARLRHWAWSKWRLWEWLPPFLFARRAPHLWLLTRKLSWRLLRGVFAGDGKPDVLGKSYLKQARVALKTEARAIDASYREQRDSGELTDFTPDAEGGFVEQLLKGPILRRGITTDAEVLAQWPLRVMTCEEMADHSGRDRKRALRRRAMMKALAQQDAELKRPEGIEALVSGEDTA